MNNRMKILIAYDGSECADEALNNLKRAGLPEELEVVVLSVADVLIPPPIKNEADNDLLFYNTSAIRRAHEHSAREVERALWLAERARDRIKTEFPRWEVRAEACADSPAWAVIRKADEWRPELIIVGSHGHNDLGGRLILGSVSQRVLYEARCSVRVGRKAYGAGDSPVRIIIGTDGSPDAEAAIEAVAGRNWPRGSEVRVVAVLDTVLSVPQDAARLSATKWVEVDNEEGLERARRIFEASTEKLRSAGLNASTSIKRGNPKQLLVEEAENWRADSIFVGARGIRGIDRLLLGSVSSAVAARANCSVEVVRSQYYDSEATGMKSRN